MKVQKERICGSEFLVPLTPVSKCRPLIPVFSFRSNDISTLTYDDSIYSTAWADDLRTHLYKCNARPRNTAAQFLLDVNLTLPRPSQLTESKNDATSATAESAGSLSQTTTEVKSDILSTLSDEQLLSLIKKVQDMYDKHVPEIRTLVLDHPALDERKYVS